MLQYSFDKLNESENLIDRSLIRHKLQPIHSNKLLDEFPDSSGRVSTSTELSATSVENAQNEIMDSNIDEINLFLNKIENKEIKINSEFDNEIILQLIDFIKSLSKDCTDISQKYNDLEIEYTELETNFWRLKEQNFQLQSENNIHIDKIYEQKEDLDNGLIELERNKTVELDTIQATIDNESKVMHFMFYSQFIHCLFSLHAYIFN